MTILLIYLSITISNNHSLLHDNESLPLSFCRLKTLTVSIPFFFNHITYNGYDASSGGGYGSLIDVSMVGLEIVCVFGVRYVGQIINYKKENNNK